jgi:hypothetical protein
MRSTLNALGSPLSEFHTGYFSTYLDEIPEKLFQSHENLGITGNSQLNALNLSMDPKANVMRGHYTICPL